MQNIFMTYRVYTPQYSSIVRGIVRSIVRDMVRSIVRDMVRGIVHMKATMLNSKRNAHGNDP
jgi:hypothetical protein